jgi:hypothetical protein
MLAVLACSNPQYQVPPETRSPQPSPHTLWNRAHRDPPPLPMPFLIHVLPHATVRASASLPLAKEPHLLSPSAAYARALAGLAAPPVPPRPRTAAIRVKTSVLAMETCMWSAPGPSA